MTFLEWLSLVSICTLAAMAPGPSLAMIIKHTLQQGKICGLICAWSHACGIAIYAILTLSGVALLLQSYPAMLDALTYLGAAYLFFLGFSAIISTYYKTNHSKNFISQPSNSFLGNHHHKNKIYAARDGLCIALFNPQAMLFFIALFTQFINNSSYTTNSILIFTPFLIDGIWFSFIVYILMQYKFSAHIKTDWLNYLFGIMLISLSISMVIK